MIPYLLPCLSLLIPLVICAMAIHWFEQVIQRSLSTRFGWKSVLWTGWLGTPIHETSHVLMCGVFRHRIDDVAFFEPDPKSGRLGYVRHSYHQGNWFEEMGNLFIGIAPLAGGSLVLLALLYLFYPNAARAAWESTSIPGTELTATDHLEVTPASRSSTLDGVGQRLWLQTSAMVSHLLTGANWTKPRWWIFLYLVLCVGSHMAPSRSDYQGSLKGGLITTVVFIALIGLLWFLHVDAKAFANATAAAGAPLLSVLALATGLCGISTLLVVALTHLVPKKRRQAVSDDLS